MWPDVIFISILFAGYSAYLMAVLFIVSDIEYENYWCDGDGLVLILTTLTTICLIYFYVSSRLKARVRSMFLRLVFS